MSFSMPRKNNRRDAQAWFLSRRFEVEQHTCEGRYPAGFYFTDIDGSRGRKKTCLIRVKRDIEVFKEMKKVRHSRSVKGVFEGYGARNRFVMPRALWSRRLSDENRGIIEAFRPRPRGKTPCPLPSVFILRLIVVWRAVAFSRTGSPT